MNTNNHKWMLGHGKFFIHGLNTDELRIFFKPSSCAIYAQWFGFAQSLRGVIMHFVGL